MSVNAAKSFGGNRKILAVAIPLIVEREEGGSACYFHQFHPGGGISEGVDICGAQVANHQKVNPVWDIRHWWRLLVDGGVRYDWNEQGRDPKIGPTGPSSTN